MVGIALGVKRPVIDLCRLAQDTRILELKKWKIKYKKAKVCSVSRDFISAIFHNIIKRNSV